MAPRHGPVTRAAVRFAIVYFALYSTASPIIWCLLTWPNGSYVGEHAWYRPVSWVATHIFGLASAEADKAPSADRLFDLVRVSMFAVMACVVVVLWTLIDRRIGPDDGRRRDSDDRRRAWLRTGLRFGLGAVLAFYGAIKVFPVQMPAPGLTRLLQPVGSLSLEELLWTWVGASHPYEQFVGGLELGAALLLFVPQTASLGALLAFTETVYILALDLTYDVVVKLFSVHLVVMASILLAPDVPRLLAVLLHRKPVPPAPETPLFDGARARRLMMAAQILFGAYVAGVHLMHTRAEWRARDEPNALMAPLYGAWNVDVMTVDNQVQAPLVTSHQRWRRIVFEDRGAFFQRMDDTFVTHEAAIDPVRHSVTLTRESDPDGVATLTFTRSAPERLVLDGQMDGGAVHLELRWLGRENFPLANHTYRLIQESPHYR